MSSPSTSPRVKWLVAMPTQLAVAFAVALVVSPASYSSETGASTRPGQSEDDPLEHLRRFERADPAADLTQALQREDRRFLAFQGFATDVPGVPEYFSRFRQFGLNVLTGTERILNDEHSRLIQAARQYAENYNRLLRRSILQGR
jgi:hypothetical protein